MLPPPALNLRENPRAAPRSEQPGTPPSPPRLGRLRECGPADTSGKSWKHGPQRGHGPKAALDVIVIVIVVAFLAKGQKRLRLERFLPSDLSRRGRLHAGRTNTRQQKRPSFLQNLPRWTIPDGSRWTSCQASGCGRGPRRTGRDCTTASASRLTASLKFAKFASGKVSEWPMVSDSKSDVPQGTRGSNPLLSANDCVVA
jgi:hypothetical protein